MLNKCLFVCLTLLLSVLPVIGMIDDVPPSQTAVRRLWIDPPDARDSVARLAASSPEATALPT